jgi:hypothetical protein
VEPNSLSLLFPEGKRTEPGGPADTGLSESTVADLDLGATVDALSDHPDHRETVRRILQSLCRDPDTIRYRQEIVADLLKVDRLADGLEAVVPGLSSLARYHRPREKEEFLYEVTWRLGELESYCACVERLGTLFDAHVPNLESRALLHLADHVRAVRSDRTFQNLLAELPDLMAQVRGIASVTLGVNLDQDLQPQAATLLRINRKRFRGASDSLLGRLFGEKRHGEWVGLAPLHSMPGGGEERSPYVRPIMVPLFRDLADVLGRSCRPIAGALERYVRINSSVLSGIGGELLFYLGARRLVRRLLDGGLPMCRPEIAPASENACLMEEGYNVNLALRFAADDSRAPGERIVCNEIEIGKAGDVFVLTGPNRGGKTTYMQAVGLAHILAQAGLYVPARSARISPVDGIYTHFPVKEHPELDTGRLGEEAQRLRELFATATSESLILLNESLSTTTPGESLILSRDVLRALSLLGCRGLYTTHLHELAREGERLNRDHPRRGRIASLVSLVEEVGAEDSPGPVRRTFKIRPGMPGGYSYAREIAARHGVSYPQLAELLRGRGVLT